MKRGTESEPVAVAWSRHQPEVREKLNAYDHAVLRAAERLIARVQAKALGPYWWKAGLQFWLFTLYGKDEIDDVSAAQRKALKALLEQEVVLRRRQ